MGPRPPSAAARPYLRYGGVVWHRLWHCGLLVNLLLAETEAEAAAGHHPDCPFQALAEPPRASRPGAAPRLRVADAYQAEAPDVPSPGLDAIAAALPPPALQLLLLLHRLMLAPDPAAAAIPVRSIAHAPTEPEAEAPIPGASPLADAPPAAPAEGIPAANAAVHPGHFPAPPALPALPSASLVAVCGSCRVVRDEHARHCRDCDKCVPGFDHHCLYLNLCVGRHNYAVFLVALAALAALLAVVVAGLAQTLHRSRTGALGRPFPFRDNADAFTSAVGVGLGISCLSLAGMITMLAFHLMLVARDTNTYAWIVNHWRRKSNVVANKR
jgi:hypothetical protein